MTSPDLINELKASRPAAPTALRARVREIAAQDSGTRGGPSGRSSGLPVRRIALVAVPAAVALAIVSAGVLGLARSGGIDDTFSKTGTSVEEPRAQLRLRESGRPEIRPARPALLGPTQAQDDGDRAGHQLARSA